jgi:hypothetical protein
VLQDENVHIYPYCCRPLAVVSIYLCSDVDDTLEEVRKDWKKREIGVILRNNGPRMTKL